MLNISKKLTLNGLTTLRTAGIRSAPSITLQRQQSLPPSSSVVWSRSLSTTPASPATPAAADDTKGNGGLWERWLGKGNLYAKEDFKNRWAMVLPAMACHMCIGSPYAWSLVADVITREQGFVASTASDWTLMETALPLSLVFFFHGLSSSILGKWQVANGPKKSMFLSSFAFAGSLLAGAAAIHFHSLPLLYLGYGALGGIGMGLGYTPPVQTLMQWFPDKKGIASGITIASFGSGALIFTPIMQSLMAKFSKLPEYLGPAENFATSVVDGKMFADVNGKLVEVIQAGAAEIAKVPYDLSEGLYLVGSGDTGAATALATLGAAYFAVIMASSLAIKNPHPTYVPESMMVTNGDNKTAPVVAPGPDFSVEEVMKKPQFYLLGTTFFCLAAGGMGLFSVAKPMMSEVFSKVLPAVVTPDFAAKFVLMVSAGNLGM
jgi:MFS family permease